MISVVNIRHYKGEHEYVGRPSVLGNPYSDKSGTTAKYKVDSIYEAVTMYRTYLLNEIDSGNREIIDELIRLKCIADHGHLILGCFCVPFTACHAEVLQDILEMELL